MKLNFPYAHQSPAATIEHLKAGTIVIIKVDHYERVYMRLGDAPLNRFQGMLVDLLNGTVCHWSKLVLGEEMVKVSGNEFY